MNRFAAGLARFEPSFYALLRFITGSLFACHGVQKVFGWLGGSVKALGSQAWVGGVIELVAGVLIALGLFTRAAAFIASGTMAVAYIQFHWKLQTADWKWLPILNKGELAALYCFVLLYFAARGAGGYSLDRRRGRA
jgi:putative oxidoreductase